MLFTLRNLYEILIHIFFTELLLKILENKRRYFPYHLFLYFFYSDLEGAFLLLLFYCLSPCLTSFLFDWSVQFNCINCVNFFSSPFHFSLSHTHSHTHTHTHMQTYTSTGTHFFSIWIHFDILANMFNSYLSFQSLFCH